MVTQFKCDKYLLTFTSNNKTNRIPLFNTPWQLIVTIILDWVAQKKFLLSQIHPFTRKKSSLGDTDMLDNWCLSHTHSIMNMNKNVRLLGLVRSSVTLLCALWNSCQPHEVVAVSVLQRDNCVQQNQQQQPVERDVSNVSVENAECGTHVVQELTCWYNCASSLERYSKQVLLFDMHSRRDDRDSMNF